MSRSSPGSTSHSSSSSRWAGFAKSSASCRWVENKANGEWSVGVDGEINYVGFAAPIAQELAHQLPEALNIIRHTGSWTATVDRDIGRPVVAQPAVSLAQVLANLWLDLHWRRMTKRAAGRPSWKMRTFKHKQQISSEQNQDQQGAGN
jgi:hypothetical protein